MEHDFDAQYYLSKEEDGNFVLNIEFGESEWFMDDYNTLQLLINGEGEIVEEKRIGNKTFESYTIEQTYEMVKENYEGIIEIYQETLKRFYPLYLLKELPEVKIIGTEARGKRYEIYFHLGDSDLYFEFFSNFEKADKRFLNLFFYGKEHEEWDRVQFRTEYLNWDLRKKLIDYFLNKSTHRTRLMFLEQARKGLS